MEMKKQDAQQVYTNIPPKEIMNAIWSGFDYKDFNKKILNEPIRDRIYNIWQRIHQCINGWIVEDKEDFLMYINIQLIIISNYRIIFQLKCKFRY